MSEHVHYSMVIEWSNLDNAYVVSFPEWERAGHIANTHGATYAEAARKGEKLLAFLIDSAQKDSDPLPAPAVFDEHAYAPAETSEDIVREAQGLLSELQDAGSTTHGTRKAQTGR